MKKYIAILFISIPFFCVKAQVATSLGVLDTRSNNDVPNFINHSIQADFKLRSTIGVPGESYYSTNLTIGQWDAANNSGDKNHQLNFNNGGIFYRNAYPLDPQWGAWKQLVLANEYGKVGIGTMSSLISPLDLMSDSFAQGIVVRKRVENDYGNLLFYDNSGSTGLGGIGVAPNRMRIISGGLGDAFERVSVTLNGLVGINSITPLNAFEVKVSTSSGVNSSDGISIHDGATYRLGLNIGVNSEREYSYLQAIKGGIGQKNIIINPSGGNVGIGIINPQNKLDVNGTIHSKEVKVDMTGWSDFVFKKEYKLPTLAEVEKHINEKGYLENIPTEAEVLKNGISLGEINAKLLQKIEELTLYMIEMKKENDQMKKKQVEFEKTINEFKNKSK